MRNECPLMPRLEDSDYSMILARREEYQLGTALIGRRCIAVLSPCPL
jgi:hypothetical protein